MKIVKALFVVILFVTIFWSNSYAGAMAGTLSDLNLQLAKEVKSKIENPLLIFQGKDLTGSAKITATVNELGKIEFTSVNSGNKNLKLNIERKLNELNLWTDSQLSGKIFVYTVKYGK